MVDWRLYEHPILEFDRGKEVTIYLDGKPMKAFENETVAAALYANGLREFSKSIKYRRPRGFFCAIGRCSACMMEVDGIPNVRTCIAMVKDGMQIKRQKYLADYLSPFLNLMKLPPQVYMRLMTRPGIIYKPAMMVMRQLTGLGSFPKTIEVTSGNNEGALEHISTEFLVVGGGPAGMEGARTAAERGHAVVLFEKTARLGGLMHQAGNATFKKDLKKYSEWSARMTEQNMNIDIRLSTEATPELIEKENPDALIIAIGAVPYIPELTFMDRSKVIWAGDIERENINPGDNILIVGAGLTGCETALKYLQAGKSVTLIDALPREQLGLGTSPINAYYLFGILEEHKVDLYADTKLIDVTKDHVVIERENKKDKLVFDTVILASGMKAKANFEFIKSLRDIVPESYVAGDCNDNQYTIWNATTSAFDAAMAI